MSKLYKQITIDNPITPSDLDDDMAILIIPDDILQLQADTINVLQGTVSLDSFSVEYQDKIVNYYKFSAHFDRTRYANIAKRTTDTLDIV